MMKDLDEPPIKIKKENENNEESTILIKQHVKHETCDIDDSEDVAIAAVRPFVNHRVRALPSWLQLPNTSTVNKELNSTVKNSEGIVAPSFAVSDQVKTVPSCSRLPDTSTVKVKTEPDDALATESATKYVKTEHQDDENSGNQLDKISAIFANGIKTEKSDDNDDLNTTSVVEVGDLVTPNIVSNPLPRNSSDDGNITGDVSSSTDVNQKPPCRFGSSCYRLNANHRRDFYHPPGSDPSKSPQKPKCKYGTQCYRRNEEHRKRFIHPRSPNNQQRLRNVGSQTYYYDVDSEDNSSYEDFSTDASEDEFHVSDEEDESETDFEEDEIESNEDEAEA